jgi:predicted metal-binding protein
VVCSTCRLSAEAREHSNGQRGGALLARALVGSLIDHPCRERIEIQTMPCLYACTSHCTVYVRSEQRFGFILGRFTPSREAAAALLDYAAQYLDTTDGLVPYARWPGGVKGHFLVRIPPQGFLWEPNTDGSLPAGIPGDPATP